MWSGRGSVVRRWWTAIRTWWAGRALVFTQPEFLRHRASATVKSAMSFGGLFFSSPRTVARPYLNGRFILACASNPIRFSRRAVADSVNSTASRSMTHGMCILCGGAWGAHVLAYQPNPALSIRCMRFPTPIVGAARHVQGQSVATQGPLRMRRQSAHTIGSLVPASSSEH